LAAKGTALRSSGCYKSRSKKLIRRRYSRTRPSMTKSLTTSIAILAILTSFSVSAQTPQPQPTPKQTTGSANTLSRTDQQFMTKAIQGDLAEVQIGKLAQQKGESSDVKQFGQMLEQDHGQNLQQAQQVANQIGLTPPTQPSAEQKATYDRLNRLSGAGFDRQF